MRSAAILALLLALPSCGKTPPAPPAPTASSTSSARPAPSVSSAAPPADDLADAGATAETDDKAVHMLEEGREPRTVVHFAFVPGRHEVRVLEIDNHVEIREKPQVHEHVVLRFEVGYPAADTVELTLRRAETTASDIPNIGTTVGATFKQKLRSDGSTAPPEATFPAGSDGTAKEYVQGAVVQLSSNLLPRVPATPIGEGARWRWGRHDAPVYRVESLRDGKIAVEVTAAIHGKRRMENGRIAPVNEDQTAHIEAPLDGIARHVASTLVVARSSGPKVTTEVHFDSTDKL
jgi:hypothetical protein